MDESYDAVSKRECCECFGDLHLSGVKCSCSPDRYSCLSHMRKLCDCPHDRKTFLYRYTMDELNLLVEGLESKKLSAMFKWVGIEQKHCASPAMKSSQPEDKGKKVEEVMPFNNSREDDVAGIKEQGKAKVKARSMAEILNTKEGNNDVKEPLVPCSKKSNRPSDSSAVNNTAKKQKRG